MCLAIPGKIMEITSDIDHLFRVGKVSFNGIVKQVTLTMVPEAKKGDFVLVHVGTAISIVDKKEAEQTMQLLLQLEDLDKPEEWENSTPLLPGNNPTGQKKKSR